jgi:Tetratricopeptide repeat
VLLPFLGDLKHPLKDHPGRVGSLINLGACLGRRFEQTGAMDDLNHALEATDEAVKATPLDHLGRAGCLNNLGNLLGRRFERTGATDDPNHAVEATDKAVKAAPSDDQSINQSINQSKFY